MKIQNVLNTKPKKSAMDNYWMDNFYVTRTKDSKKDLPKLGKIFMGLDYGPDSDKYKKKRKDYRDE